MKMAFWIFTVLAILISFAIFQFQHKLIFFPEVLPSDHQFRFEHQFAELNFPTKDGGSINALHFQLNRPVGVVFYNHGNAGSLRNWGLVADDFLKHNYELFIYDYRGFGKSRGKISEQSLYEDAKILYEGIVDSVGEQNIIVYGRSIGTGIATKIASDHNPKQLILESPFYNFKDVAKSLFPFIPYKLIRYDFPNNERVREVKAPITIFHGKKDEVVYFGSSVKLMRHLSEKDRLVKIEEGHHNDLSEFNAYHEEMARILE